MNKIIHADVLTGLKQLPDASIQCVVTSPPYWGLRDYGNPGQLGLEKTPEEYVAKMVEVFREVRRVLRDDGTLWLNLGDMFMNKQLIGMPWRVAFALQADGWYLRQDIIWQKPNPMPESVTDRCTKSHEYIFLLTKSAKYYYDAEAVKEPCVTDIGKSQIRFGGSKYGDSDDPKHATKSGNVYKDSGLRNLRDVWSIATKPYKGAHFAVFPEAIPERCIKAGTKTGDVVLDPFAGSGTTLAVAKRLRRQYVGIELNEKYLPLIEHRLLSVPNKLF